MLDAINIDNYSACCIEGMGGIGKTALGLKLAEIITRNYPDAQLFLDLRGVDLDPLRQSQIMKYVVLSFYPEKADLPSEGDLLRGLYYSAIHGKRILLFLDNAKSAEQVAHLLPSHGSLTILTSREHLSLPGAIFCNVDPLAEHDAQKLIRKIAPKTNLEEAVEIARLCDCIPLAIMLAASTLVGRRDLKPSAYLQQLEKVGARLSLIEKSLQVSYDLLSDDLKKRFRQLGWLTRFDIEDVQVVWTTNADDAEISLIELQSSNLVQSGANDVEGAMVVYYMHDLVRLFAFMRLKEFPQELSKLVKDYGRYFVGEFESIRDRYEFKIIDRFSYQKRLISVRARIINLANFLLAENPLGEESSQYRVSLMDNIKKINVMIGHWIY